MPFTHDESYTYLHFCNETFMEIISYHTWHTNNHILNSLLIKYSEVLLGSAEWALRLPNLLSLLIYMLYGYLLFKQSNALVAISSFVLLCTNGMVMDLFGLARGYGLSYGFMLMGVYHLIEYLKDKRYGNLALFHTAALLACLSHFTMLTFYAAGLAIYNIIVFINYKLIIGERYKFLKSNKAHIIPLIIVVIVLYEPVRRILKFGGLNVGGKEGFYANTVTDLIANALNGVSLPTGAMISLQVICTGIVLLSLAIIAKMIWKKNKQFFNNQVGLIVTNFLLLTICVAIMVLHWVIGADFPTTRFALFLFPLFVVHLGFLANYLVSAYKPKLTIVIMSSLALLSVYSFVRQAHFYSSGEWAYDRNTKEMLLTLASHREQNNITGEVDLGINWLYEPTINFYRVTKKLDWLNPVNRDGISPSDDYFYIFKNDIHQLDNLNYEVVKDYANSNSLLIVNKK